MELQVTLRYPKVRIKCLYLKTQNTQIFTKTQYFLVQSVALVIFYNFHILSFFKQGLEGGEILEREFGCVLMEFGREKREGGGEYKNGKEKGIKNGSRGQK